MENEHRIVARVYAAKTELQDMDALIESSMPFIQRQTARFLGRPCRLQDDELSIAMMAFHEAVGSYAAHRGAFFPFAALMIRSRLVDYVRQQKRHAGHLSLESSAQADESPLGARLHDLYDPYEESAALAATKQEIGELSCVMKDFGISLSDVADNSPRQKRTKEQCAVVIASAIEDPSILQTLLRTKKLPMTALVQASGVPKKTLERHRKYLLAMLLIQTNGYEIIRRHIARVLPVRGGAVL